MTANEEGVTVYFPQNYLGGLLSLNISSFTAVQCRQMMSLSIK
jgi:hypothetical protein